MRKARAILGFAASAAPGAALAHADGQAAAVPWTAWNITPDILAGTIIVAALYGAGLWKERRRERTAPRWRHWAFFSGLAAVFVALQSPLDALADHLFFMHQVQHLLLQTVGPMLLVLAAGLLFYWCVFDPRLAPLGATYGTRVNILLFETTANMLLGAALALKDTALYTAYDQIGRLWELRALTDERVGGLIMWIPGSALCVPAFLVVLHRWNLRESRLDERRRRGVTRPVPAEHAGNLGLAFRLAAVALAAFAATFAVVLVTTGQRF